MGLRCVPIRGALRMPSSKRGQGGNIAFFVAVFVTALALGAAMAHALELANKIGLPREDYFVVTALRH